MPTDKVTEKYMPTIRVMLVDHHVMVRRGLAVFLRVFNDLHLVGEADSGEAAIRLCAEARPDLVLMEMVLPDMDGVSLTRSIRQKFPQVRVIALTNFKAGGLIKKALEAGVIGYLHKDISADQLARAIRSALSGRATISAEAAQALVETANREPASGLNFTEPEREIFALTMKGLNNSQISGKLNVNPTAVKSHLSNILSKLSFASHTETVTLAFHNRIVPCPNISIVSGNKGLPILDMAFQ